MIRFFISILITVAITEQASGQVLGPELRTGNTEIGYFHAWYHRNFDRDSPYENSAQSATIYLRQKLHNAVTLSLESMITNYDYVKGFPERDYRRFTIGAGIVFRIFSFKSNLLAVSIHYKEWMSFDRSRHRNHQNSRNLSIAIQTEREFELHNQLIFFWGGPAYIRDQVKQYPDSPYIPYTDESYNNVGFAVGINSLIHKHFDPFVHIVYADYFQPRIGLGCQF
jgi:hypothetical protein